MPGMTDRDYFAAAALTGLLAQGDDGSFSEESYARGAYRWADAMLRERERTNHDAAPAATASVESVAPQPTTRGDSDRTDKAAPRPSEGTGDTPKPINDCVSDRSKPINVPDPDSRVWETPVHTPATHATHVEGSERRECTEPVAWAVSCDYGDYGVALFSDEASAQTEADRRALVGLRPGYVVVPLYRHPPCQDVSQKNLTLTDAEREAVERAVDSIASTMPYESQQGLADWKTLRGLLERTGGEK